MGARIGGRRSPRWSCRLEEVSSESYFCLPLSHSVTLGKTLPAPSLRFLIYPCLYSAVRIRLGATSEFTRGKMREGLVVPDPGSLICWVWLWAGASDQPCTLGTKGWEFLGLQGAALTQPGGQQVHKTWAVPGPPDRGKQHICACVSTSCPLSTCCFYLGVGVRVRQEAKKRAGVVSCRGRS